jgi:hypothetical protein
MIDNIIISFRSATADKCLRFSAIWIDDTPYSIIIYIINVVDRGIENPILFKFIEMYNMLNVDHLLSRLPTSIFGSRLACFVFLDLVRIHTIPLAFPLR